MKENEKKKAAVQVTEGNPVPGTNETAEVNGEGRFKKPLIFSVMGLLFIGCLYLIFGRNSGDKAKDVITVGINAAVPQASGDGLPTDKGKAYEQEMLQEKERKKRETLMTLSDYWQSDSTQQQSEPTGSPKNGHEIKPPKDMNPALSSYKTMQHSLGNFYQRDPAQDALKSENERLKAQLETRQAAQGQKPDDRLALMEKSYQMAAKYFPGTVQKDSLTAKPSKQKPEDEFITVVADRKSVVSQLYRKVPDSLLLARLANGEQQGFATASGPQDVPLPANSIRACIHQSLKLVGEGSVQLRLQQDVRIGKAVLPSGSTVTASTKFQGNRLQMQVVSVEIDGSIVPVNLSVYDLDGQKGLNLPYAPEVTAVNGTLANMGSTSGSSFTLNRSAGQQLTSDMTRGLIQGVSGYFSKRVTAQKATLKQGYQLFLVSKQK
ncbi:conjugative transposon protein TraM [Flavobacterium zepuense]|nr:conjugative transposon protein TraM [Flavobacterium zepuense]